MDSDSHNNSQAQQAGEENGAVHSIVPSNEVVNVERQLQPQAPRATGHGLRALRPLLPLRTKPVAPQSTDAEPHKGNPFLLALSALVLSALITLIITVPLLPTQLDVTPGTPVLQDVISPASFSYPSKVLTDRARDLASKDPANEVWVQDTNLIQLQRTLLLNALAVVQDARLDQEQDIGDKRQRLTSMPDVKLTESQVDM